MFFWFGGLSLVIVWLVFKDTAIDYRILFASATVPALLDLPFSVHPFHSVVVTAGLLCVIMLATRHRRKARRRLLMVPIGMFLHLFLDGIWTVPAVMWWPLLSGDQTLPFADRSPVLLVAQELIGIGACY